MESSGRAPFKCKAVQRIWSKEKGRHRPEKKLEIHESVGKSEGVNPESLRFFNPFANVRKTANKLPHWQQPGATYFITFRLADAVPMALRLQWTEEKRAWLSQHPKPWSAVVEAEYHERFSARMDAWLDAGHGACVLRDTSCRNPVEATLQHLDGSQYWHHGWVIMPNHVHALTSLNESATLEDAVGAWKSVSARDINRPLKRKGTLWQEDFF